MRREFRQEPCRLPLRANERHEGQDIIDGNSAAALGCMFAGVTVATWYPITPSSSLCEALGDYMKDYRMDENGKSTFANRSGRRRTRGRRYGARRRLGGSAVDDFHCRSWNFPHAGIRRARLLRGKIPTVIFDITPRRSSTGLPTRTQQVDILSLVYCSHGDTKHIVLLRPASASASIWVMKRSILPKDFRRRSS